MVPSSHVTEYVFSCKATRCNTHGNQLCLAVRTVWGRGRTVRPPLLVFIACRRPLLDSTSYDVFSTRAHTPLSIKRFLLNLLFERLKADSCQPLIMAILKRFRHSPYRRRPQLYACTIICSLEVNALIVYLLLIPQNLARGAT
jgi:hypothetical protein